jgi:hypothetical protein
MEEQKSIRFAPVADTGSAFNLIVPVPIYTCSFPEFRIKCRALLNGSHETATDLGARLHAPSDL